MYLYVDVEIPIYNCDGLGRIQCLCRSSADVPKWGLYAVQALTYQNGDYMGSLNKKASGAQCFILALGLFWDIVTGLPWTPNGVGSLGPRGYCIFLPGAHYLTINSPYGADSSLNKLLLLLLLLLLNNISLEKIDVLYNKMQHNPKLLLGCNRCINVPKIYQQDCWNIRRN